MARHNLHHVFGPAWKRHNARRLRWFPIKLVQDTTFHRPAANADSRLPNRMGLVPLVGLEDVVLQRQQEQRETQKRAAILE